MRKETLSGHRLVTHALIGSRCECPPFVFKTRTKFIHQAENYRSCSVSPFIARLCTAVLFSQAHLFASLAYAGAHLPLLGWFPCLVDHLPKLLHRRMPILLLSSGDTPPPRPPTRMSTNTINTVMCSEVQASIIGENYEKGYITVRRRKES